MHEADLTLFSKSGALKNDALSWIRHREERSDVAIHGA
jgi:hypothetical protein